MEGGSALTAVGVFPASLIVLTLCPGLARVLGLNDLDQLQLAATDTSHVMTAYHHLKPEQRRDAKLKMRDVEDPTGALFAIPGNVRTQQALRRTSVTSSGRGMASPQPSEPGTPGSRGGQSRAFSEAGGHTGGPATPGSAYGQLTTETMGGGSGEASEGPEAKSVKATAAALEGRAPDLFLPTSAHVWQVMQTRASDRPKREAKLLELVFDLVKGLLTEVTIFKHFLL